MIENKMYNEKYLRLKENFEFLVKHIGQSFEYRQWLGFNDEVRSDVWTNWLDTDFDRFMNTQVKHLSMYMFRERK